MISKNKLKLIRTLAGKKARTDAGLFIAEGRKTIEELLPAFRCIFFAATQDYIAANAPVINRLLQQGADVQPASPEELRKASLLVCPHDALAVFQQKKEIQNPHVPENELSLALDNVQDPGNFGAIIRIADWFGINRVYCSPDCADPYNPKTVQASMGALAHVEICRASLPELIDNAPRDLPVFGTFLDGDNVYQQILPANALVVLGNEGNGIGKATAARISLRLRIPNSAFGRPVVESLNVAAAAAVICSEFRRHSFLTGKYL